MAEDSPLGRLGRALEGLLFGEHAGRYRTFVRATFVVSLGLVGAYVLARTGVVPLASGVVSVLGIATGVAVCVLVLSGVVEFVVLGRVYQHGSTEVAQAAADLERAADHLEETATELETTVEEVEDAAETVDEAADEIAATADTVAETETTPDVGAVSEKASEARTKTEDARETADAVSEDAEHAKRTAEAVEAIAAEKRERLPGATATDEAAESDATDGDDESEPTGEE